MGSPQKKNTSQLYESPYARHLSQYPSQSEGFVPCEFGGKNSSGQSSGSNQHQHQHHGNNYHKNNSNQRRRGNNRYFNAPRGSVGSGGNNLGGHGGGGGGGYRNQNNYNEHQGNRGNRQQPYHGQKYNKQDGNSRNDYYHPSMLVDPWKDLLERHNAIKNSQISTTTSDSEHEPTASSPEQSAISDDTDGAVPSTTPTTSQNSPTSIPT